MIQKKEGTKMKNCWIKLFALSLALTLALTACGGKPSDAKGPVETDPAEATNTPVDYSKYNAYIDLADEMSDIEEVLGVYFENVAYQEEFAVLEGGDYANIKEAVRFFTGLSYAAEKARGYAKEEPAYPDADAAVLALGDSVNQVMDALEHLGSYMRFDDFVDDGMARAPELHAELWAALQTYDVYYPEFLDALSALDEQTDQENLELLKESGQTILYQSQLLMDAAQDIQGEMWGQLNDALEATPEGEEFTLPAIDMTPLSPLFDRFNTAYSELTAALDSETEREKVPAFVGKMGDNTVTLYTNKVNSLYVKTGTLAQVLLEGDDYVEALDDMDEAITGMISAYNNVI